MFNDTSAFWRSGYCFFNPTSNWKKKINVDSQDSPHAIFTINDARLTWQSSGRKRRTCFLACGVVGFQPQRGCEIHGGFAHIGRCFWTSRTIHRGFPSMEMFHFYDFPVWYTIHIPFSSIYHLWWWCTPILKKGTIGTPTLMRPRWDSSPESSAASPLVQVCKERTRDPEGDGGCEVRPEVLWMDQWIGFVGKIS